MHEHIKAYFRSTKDEEGSEGHFRQVIALHEERKHSWDEIVRLCPTLPRGWHELAILPSTDRIDFLRDFWMMKLPFHPLLSPFLNDFFSSLDDVGVFLTQGQYDEPWRASLVYSVKDDRTFFRGSPPISKEDIGALKVQFAEFVLPADYLAFFEIHDGFCKYTDTGLYASSALWRNYKHLVEHLEELSPLLAADSTVVNPKRLLPFYESFGFPCYQCFWAEWYPDNEMGNVYYSGLTHTISDHTSARPRPERMAFPTFLDWLMFYLETIKV